MRSPLSGEIIATVPHLDRRRHRRGRGDRPGAAAAGLGGPSVAERPELLLDFHDHLLDRRDDFIDLLQTEGGKARLSAIEEVLHVALTARYYGRTARRYLHSERGERHLPAAHPDRPALRAQGSGRASSRPGTTR